MAGKVTFQKAINANAYKNVGGTVLYAGAITGRGVVTKSLTSTPADMNGSHVPGSGATTFVTCAKSQLNFAKLVPNQYLILGFSTKIGGVASSALSTACTNKPAISMNASKRTVAVQASDWDWVTGKPGSVSGVENYWYGIAGSADSATADQAASPTRAVPGELVMLETGKTPTQKDYQKRTN